MSLVIDLSPSLYFDLEGYAHSQLFEDCHYVWEALNRLKAYLEGHEGRIEGSVSERAFLEGEGISIGAGTIVEAGAYIRGPCIIGENCQIRHGAYIRGDLVTGDRCVIGGEVKGAIFLDGAQAAHFAYVGDSILGNRVNLGAGTKLANFKLSGQPIAVASIDTGRRKLGAVLGDGCQLGCNTVTNPGTLMGKNGRSFASTSLGGVIPPSALLGEPYVSA